MSKFPSASEYLYYNSLHAETHEEVTYFSDDKIWEVYLEAPEILAVSESLETVLCSSDNPLIPESVCFDSKFCSWPRPLLPPEHIIDRTVMLDPLPVHLISLGLIRVLRTWLEEHCPMWRVVIELPTHIAGSEVVRIVERKYHIVIYPGGIRFGSLPFDDDVSRAYAYWQEWYLKETEGVEALYEKEFREVEHSIPEMLPRIQDSLIMRRYQFTLGGKSLERLWVLGESEDLFFRKLLGVSSVSDSTFEIPSDILGTFGVTSSGEVDFWERVEAGSPNGKYFLLMCYQFPAISSHAIAIQLTDDESEGNYTVSRPPLEFPINPSDVIKHA